MILELKNNTSIFACFPNDDIPKGGDKRKEENLK